MCDDLKYHVIRFELKFSTESENIFQLNNAIIYKGKLHTHLSQNHVVYPEILNYFLFAKNYELPIYGSGLLDVPDGVEISFDILNKNTTIANVYINMPTILGRTDLVVTNTGSFNCTAYNTTKSFFKTKIIC